MASAYTAYRQFGRKYKILVRREKSGTSIDISDLRCVFQVEKAISGDPDYSQISVTNMNVATMDSINKGDMVILEAGYESGNYGMIFAGKVCQKVCARIGTDRTMVLVCQDGDDFLTNNFICSTIGAGTDDSDVIKACMENATDVEMGNITDDISDTQRARGKVMFGKASEYMANVANTANSQFYISDGKVNITAAGDYENRVAVELNPSTGLIGTPNQKEDGITCQCLLNPSLKLNSLVHVSSNLVSAQLASKSKTPDEVSVDGIYKITKMTYTGDTRGEDWYCDFEAIVQNGLKPAALTGKAADIWR